jgi:hypothetical protein
MLCLSYYYLYSLFNKIRDKGRTVSAWKRRVRGKREERVEREGLRVGGRNGPNIVCIYE